MQELHIDRREGTVQGELKYNDKCRHMEDAERAGLGAFALLSLVVWIVLGWWYLAGNEKT